MKYLLTIFLTYIITFCAVHFKYEDVITENDQLKRDKKDLLNIRAKLLNEIKEANKIFNSAYYMGAKTDKK